MISSARTHARRSLLVYLSLTALGLILLWPFAGDFRTTVLHVLSAVSTGGFSSFDDSLAGLGSPAAAVVVIVVSFLGAVSFLLYWQLAHDWRGGIRNVFNNLELRALLLACLLTGGLLTFLGWIQEGGVGWYHSFMMAVSAQTTTGFETVAPAQMDPASKLVMIISMLIGGSAGSSAGGIKLLRVLILLRLLQLMIRRTAMPQHAVSDPYLAGRKLDFEDVIRALQLISLFVGILVISWIPFLVMGYDPLDSLFEVVSACGTVGLSSGISRSELEPILKAVLCFDMLAGRVEVFAMLVLLYPRTWFGKRKEIE
jgi:trk system potassium uptake protein TrkH